MDVDLKTIDQWCSAVYTDVSGEGRARAEEQLRGVLLDSLPRLMDALVATSSPYTAMVCALRLVPTFKEAHTDIPVPEQDRIFGAMLDTLVKLQVEGDPVMKHVVPVLRMALCRMNKLVLDARGGQSYLIDRAVATVTPNSDFSAIGPTEAVLLEALAAFVAETQLHDSNRTAQFMTFGMHRKASTSLRDGPLKNLFSYVVEMFRKVRQCANPPMHEVLLQLSNLAATIMTYDFMAIIVDETEEMYVTQFPSDWKDVLNDDAIRVIGDCHLQLPGPYCHHLLRAVIGLIGTRRSFYEDDDMKTRWLDFFMEQLVAVQGSNDNRLGDPEYCALLAEAIARFSPPHGYRDLIKCPAAQRWFTFVAEFTMTMFQVPFGDGCSFTTTTTLMQFWCRIVGSKRIAKADDPPPGDDIEEFIAPMVGAYAKTRVSQPDYEIDDDALDSINSQADLLPGMLSLCPQQSVTAMLQCATETGESRIASCCSTMVWLAYIGGGIVRHWFNNISEDNVPCASALLAFISSCVSVYQSNSNRTDTAVENALVYFLSQLQHTFASTRLSTGQTMIIESVYRGKVQLFQFILDSIGSNMLSTVLEPQTIRNSIELIVEACKELPTEQLAALNFNLPPVEQLPMSRSEHTFKLRTQLLKALYTVRLPNTYTYETFERFLQPTEALMMANNSDPLFVAGWLRDLRGVASAVSTGTGAADFLDWLMERDQVFTMLSSQALPPIIVNSFNKLLLQLVMPNYPSSRVNLPSMTHSAAGIYLFQFVSTHLKALLTNSVLSSAPMNAVHNRQEHPEAWVGALKPLSVALDVCRRCITGEFCPFGAMVLYGDDRLDTIVCGMVSVVKMIPPEAFKQYPKLSAALQYLLRSLTESNVVAPFVAMPTEDLLALIQTSLAIVADADEKAVITSHALNFLGLIGNLFPVVQRIRNGTVDPSAHRNSPTQTRRQQVHALAAKFVDLPTLWDDLVIAAMNVVTTQDRGLSPACSLVFPIFDADPSKWQQYRNHLLSTYPPQKQAKVAELLDALGTNVGTQDAFFSGLVTFRMNIRMV